MKRSFKILLWMVSALVLVFCTVACGSEKTVSISVSENAEFQTVYVLGQELNLSGGMLKVDDGKNTSEIPLNSEGITVSGYDKNVLGKQTLTVTYEGATTEITVTVVEALTVNNALVDYLVGDELDKSKGNVKVTNPDGTSHTVPLSSSSVSVSGFDSSSAKSDMELQVTCSIEGKNYEGSFKVNVYGIESVEFRRPNKITYTSHYQGNVDVSGGRLVLKGNGGSIRREVAISEDMVSGFNVAAVTSENSPLTQTLTVTYKGVPYTYDIQLTYTDVSTFLDHADAFHSVDWNQDSEPVIESDLGELAILLMRAYVDMTPADKAFIDEALAFDVARTAMVYGFEVWGDNIRLFKDVFAIEYGEKVLYLESYEKVKNALAIFDDKDSAMYTLAPLLLQIIELYDDQVIYENESVRIHFNSYPIMTDYELSVMEAMLEHSIEVYDLINTVPDDWREGGIEAHYESIGQAAIRIIGESYISEYPDMYYLISDWRSGNDFFDIIYRYLYETDNHPIIEKFIAYGLPSQINEIYGYIFNAAVAMDDIQKVTYTDTTDLFYNYYLAYDCAQKVKAQEGTAENYIYMNVPINLLLGLDSSNIITFDVMFEYMRTAACGYNDLSAGLLGIEAYDAIMREYVYLIKHTLEIDAYESSEAYAESVKRIFDGFVALSPSQQYNLISTLNSLYTLGVPELAFDDSGEDAGYSSLFMVIINKFMRSKLTEEYADAYNDLIIAIEVYANRFGYDVWESDFTSRMNKVIAAFNSMDGTNKENFVYYLGGAYEKYVKIQNTIGSTAELGEWADDFDDLCKALTDMQTAYYYLSSSNSRNYNYFLASFEKASDIAAKILANAPENVLHAYYHEPLFTAFVDNGDVSGEDALWSCDYAIGMYRNFYVDTLLFFGSSEVNIYDTYLEKELDKFLSLYYDMVSAFVNKNENQSPVFDKEKTLAVLKAFCNLDSNTKSLFVTMEGDLNLYYTALQLFISEGFTEDAATVAELLFNLEKNYYSYEVSQSAVNMNAIKEILGQIQALHDGLKNEDVDSFAALEDIYQYYIGKCEQLVVTQ
ncbi:MAG: hypothetical protein E7645_00700 [Ruminococcaceae bacterium]|nr:hypothetical protein [Oscillospiraceae bacterium]